MRTYIVRVILIFVWIIYYSNRTNINDNENLGTCYRYYSNRTNINENLGTCYRYPSFCSFLGYFILNIGLVHITKIRENSPFHHKIFTICDDILFQ